MLDVLGLEISEVWFVMDRAHVRPYTIRNGEMIKGQEEVYQVAQSGKKHEGRK
jgi:hypothetical protein